MRLIFWFGICLLTVACTSQGDNVTQDAATGDTQIIRAEVTRVADAPEANVAAVVEGNTQFAFDFYQTLASSHDGNLIFSPYSISLAFSMLYAGANGETATQMADVMHFELPQEQLHPAFSALDLMLQPLQITEPTPTPPPTNVGWVENPASELTLNISNSIWGQDGFSFNDAYLETLAMNYGAGLGIVDFSGNPDVAYQTISQWVEAATAGRIQGMPPRDAITPDTRLALVNAIYFKGEWTYPFSTNNTHDAAFHTLDNNEVDVQMMVNDFAYMSCVRGNNYYAVELTYGEERYRNAAMLVIIPDSGAFQQVESQLDEMLLHEMIDGLQSTNMLTFSMPRFAFESEVDLQATLSDMGMSAVFSSGADFSGISPEGLFIGYAGHKATISVDEQGTEASGVTTVMMAQSAVFTECGNDVIADRPFIFAIYDNQTQTILFLGRVLNPAN